MTLQSWLGKRYNRLLFLKRHTYLSDHFKARWHSLQKSFDSVEAFCLFIGYPRSGLSCLGLSG